MNDVLLRVASKQRPRENNAEQVVFDLYKFIVNFEIKRTFICEAPMVLLTGTV